MEKDETTKLCCKIYNYYTKGIITADENTKWQEYVRRGLLTETNIDKAIYKKSHGYPFFTFYFPNPNMIIRELEDVYDGNPI